MTQRKSTAVHVARIRQQDPHPYELAQALLSVVYTSERGRDQ
jgi:hypothetical protein